MKVKVELTTTDKEVTIKFLPSNDTKAEKIVKMIKGKAIKLLM